MDADEVTARIAELEAERDALAEKYSALTEDHDRLRTTYDKVLLELRRLQRGLFGRKAEAVDTTQASLAFQLVMGLIANSPAPPPPPPADDEAEDGSSGGDGDKPKGSGGNTQGNQATGKGNNGRRPLPEHLPLERIVLLPAGVTDEMLHLYEVIGEEVTEELEHRSASLVRVHYVRPKLVLRRAKTPAPEPAPPAPRSAPEAAGSDGAADDALVASGELEVAAAPPPPAALEARTILIAPLPDRPIHRCLAGPGLLAHILVQKYAYHLPLHRLERMFANEGVELARSTMGGWVEASATLLKPIVDAMAKDALLSPWIGIDATGVLVQAKEQCRRGHFWVLVAARDHVLFRFSAKHVKEEPRDFLRGYTGYVQADASSVYEHLYRTEAVTEVGCHAHNRRGFFDALGNDKERALAGIGFLNKLFAIERDLKDAPPARRLQERQRRSRPVLDAFEAWVDAQLPAVTPRSAIASALGYAQNQRVPLRRFLDDGRLRIDNNLSELELRRQAVGRKNWLFLGSEDGAEWNTTIVSLVASCELHGLDPHAYFRDVLTILGDFPNARVLDLAPKYWRATREQLVADGRLSGALAPRLPAANAAA